jgi:hypothetical protein
MSTNNNTPKRPTHRVYHEVKNKDGKTVRSSEIGAIWPNANGSGFNMKLDYVPVNFTGWLNIRPIDETGEAAA